MEIKSVSGGREALSFICDVVNKGKLSKREKELLKSLFTTPVDAEEFFRFPWKKALIYKTENYAVLFYERELKKENKKHKVRKTLLIGINDDGKLFTTTYNGEIGKALIDMLEHRYNDSSIRLFLDYERECEDGEEYKNIVIRVQGDVIAEINALDQKTVMTIIENAIKVAIRVRLYNSMREKGIEILSDFLLKKRISHRIEQERIIIQTNRIDKQIVEKLRQALIEVILQKLSPEARVIVQHKTRFHQNIDDIIINVGVEGRAIDDVLASYGEYIKKVVTEIVNGMQLKTIKMGNHIITAPSLPSSVSLNFYNVITGENETLNVRILNSNEIITKDSTIVIKHDEHGTKSFRVSGLCSIIFRNTREGNTTLRNKIAISLL